MMSSPRSIDSVMLPKVIGTMLVGKGCSFDCAKNVAKWMFFFLQLNILFNTVFTATVSPKRFRGVNVNNLGNRLPTFAKIFFWSTILRSST